ncbi:MAG: hypothetical protein KGN01_07780 [Patescibacteria group bacterium]|nr:hypothetical protein [Patescibacteria group bacterium]
MSSIIGWLASPNWLLIKAFVADTIAITVFYRIFGGKWVWSVLWQRVVQAVTNQKPPAYKFGFTENGWSFEGQGQNPIMTLKKLWGDINGENRTIEEDIESLMKHEIRDMTRKVMHRFLQRKDIRRYYSKLISESMQRYTKTKFRE